MNLDLLLEASVIRNAVRASLIDDDRRKFFRGNPCPVAGHCYVASEAAYHILGGRSAGWTPVCIQHEGGSHWFLRHSDGTVLDITADQFQTPVPYAEGRGRGFLTKAPSKRAAAVIIRTLDVLDSWA